MTSRTITGPAPGPAKRPAFSRHALFIAPIVVALLLVAVGGYVLHWHWTGYLTPRPEPPSTQQAPRSLWDWLTLALQPIVLLAIPVMLEIGNRRRGAWRLGAAVGAVVLVVLIVGGYGLGWRWTGFSGNTLWDWLGLFLVPFALPLVFHFLAAERRRSDGASAPERDEELLDSRDTRPLSHNVVVIGGLIAALLVVAGFVAGWATRTTQASATAGGANSRFIQVASATIPANARDWTDTHVTVTEGERVDVSSVGLARSGRGLPAVGPGGEPASHATANIAPALPHLSLIATIAPRGTSIPVKDPHVPGRVLGVGQLRTFVAPASGELMLGVNDTGADNNSGWYGATISVVAARP